MGKRGKALREAKASKTTYVFTREQLEHHDKLVCDNFRDRIMEDCEKKLQKKAEMTQKNIDAYLEEEWKKREALMKTEGDNLNEMLSLLLSISSRILIEKFHWKPIPKDEKYDGRNNTAKFAKYYAEEVNLICSDEMKDIRKYCEETFDLYVVRYSYGTESEGASS